ncbi:MAG: type II toxin-antitoxin system RelE/ParE family toxin [Candidatus Omnitrophica bacterium]|nr:type II toxin-antitoxin system RelE/ParE family toxin [Candidatus Omnitrophota bacterium]
MEQNPQEEVGVGPPRYKVLWHPDAKRDLSNLSQDIVEHLVEAAQYKLSTAPQFIGQPIKGTTRLLWKVRFSKYRVVYTMNDRAKEVCVLAVGKRDAVYRDANIQSWVKLAIAIQAIEKARR